MRKLTSFLSVLVLGAALALPALAGSPQGNTTRTHHHWLAGQIVAVGTSSLSVGVLWTGPNDGALLGQTVNLAVNGSTAFVGPHGSDLSLGSLTAGQLVGVRADGVGTDLTALTATRVHAYCNCHWVGGTITALGTNSVSLSVGRTGPYDTVLAGQTVTIPTDGNTAFLQGAGKRQIGFGDLKVGEGVGIVFSANGFFRAPGFDWTKANLLAARVHVWAHGHQPTPSSDGSVSAAVAA